jgi:hypothetical protein
MLSIGKVGGGQASPSYYVEHVAQGAEDYYAGKGEARGLRGRSPTTTSSRC